MILAGGEGKRLWPWCGPDLPKPLLPLGRGGRSLLGATLDRLSGLVDPDRIVLQAAHPLGHRLLDGETRLAQRQWHPEPEARDTGPAIALAMLRVYAQDPQAVVAILPADHRVERIEPMQQALRSAAIAAQAGQLVILGVRPTRAATEFGYVEADQADSSSTLPVQRFVEKPDAARAADFVASGRHYWNAGIFVWRADRFRAALEREAPQLLQSVERYLTHDDITAWRAAPKISIDYALMEKVSDLQLVPLDAGWDDLGGWEAVARLASQDAAGPVRLRPLLGVGADGSIALSVSGDPRPVALLSAGPWLHVDGPLGTLLVPRGSQALLKSL